MKILYDGGIYAMQKAGGINSYFSGIIQHMPESFVPIVTTTQLPEVSAPEHGKLRWHQFNRFAFRPGRFSYWLEKHYFRTVEWLEDPDLIHPTFYRTLTRHKDTISSRPYVLTVWDFLHEHFPGQLDTDGSWAKHVNRMIRGARHLLCISEHTRQELLVRFPDLQSQSTVTPLASSIHGKGLVPQKKASMFPPYLLFVGARHGYKNFLNALTTFDAIAKWDDDLRFSVVGPGWTEDERRYIGSLRCQDRIDHHGMVSSQSIQELYCSATLLLYPSLSEGFGLPVLEAISCGCPVIASSGTSIPEILGADYDLMCDTSSVDEMVSRAENIIGSDEARNYYANLGLQRAALFDWRNCAAKTVAIYRSVLEDK